MNLWCQGTTGIIILIIVNFIYILFAALKKVSLKKPKYWFKNNENFRNEKQRLEEHEDRILGTLIFWKNKAALHNRMVMSRTYWGLISSILIPVLLQYYKDDNIYANAFMTILSTWVSFITILSFTLKSDEKYRGYRQCESDYYDLARELLDNISSDDKILKLQVSEFIISASQIRRLGRAVETDSTISLRTNKNAISINQNIEE
jgi:hypothetical protein